MKRKCWDCGNVAEHADSVVPHVLCKKCGSQDTRLIRQPATAPKPICCCQSCGANLYPGDDIDYCQGCASYIYTSRETGDGREVLP